MGMLREFLKEEDAFAVVEVALICAILISLAIVFRKSLMQYCKALADKVLGTS